MTCRDKEITITLNPFLFEAVERLAYVNDQSVEQFLEESVGFLINHDILNKRQEIGTNTCDKLKQLLEQAGIEVW